jgi:transcriptional regulator with XRE-family HTH domain
LHQLGRVRRREGVSRRAIARRLGVDVKQIRFEEDERSDMSLSRLYQWQAALGVPIAELLVDDDGALSQPILKRAKMLRIMKTAAAIRERADSMAIERMAGMLIDQILDIMPELKDVGPWNAVGQRRTLDELGEAANRRLSMDALFDMLE